MAMQVLCHYEAQQGLVFDILKTLMNSADEPASEESLAYAQVLAQQYVAAPSSIDDRIRGVLDRWNLERIVSVDRNVMRVATAELIRQETPPKVVLDEAIEIARTYGSPESGRFVNGVLDALWKRMVGER